MQITPIKWTAVDGDHGLPRKGCAIPLIVTHGPVAESFDDRKKSRRLTPACYMCWTCQAWHSPALATNFQGSSDSDLTSKSLKWAHPTPTTHLRL